LIPARLRRRAERENLWRELDRRVAALERVRGRSRYEDLEELGRLYRRGMAELGLLRTQPAERATAAALNQVLLRAHTQIYRPQRVGGFASLASFLGRSLPAAARRNARAQLFGAACMVAGAALGWMLVAREPDLYWALHPFGDERTPGADAETLREVLVGGRDTESGGRSLFTGFLWQHNTKVALLAWAAGALAGIPTVLLLTYSGMTLGAMSWLYASSSLATPWFAWIAGHGVTELWAIVLASAGGFRLARAIVDPGQRSRAAALREEGRESLRLAVGAALMLLVAAVLEGYFRQTSASDATRFAVAGVTGAAWLAWFSLGGRVRRPPQSATAGID